MKSLLVIISVFLSQCTWAIGPSSFDIKPFKVDVKFSGIVLIDKAQTIYSNDGQVCAVSYSAKVLENIYGSSDGQSVTLHMYKDIRDDRFSFLEAGTHYFVYAESQASHSFVQLSDGHYKFPEYPEACQGTNEAFNLYREFSRKLQTRDNNTYIESPALHQIEGTNAIAKVFYSRENYETVVEIMHIYDAYRNKLDYLGMEKNAFVKFFKQGLIK